MGRNLILVLLGIVVLLLALDAGGVIPLGILGDGPASDESGESGLLGADGDQEGGPTLEGMGGKGLAKKAGEDPLVSEAPVEPSEVRGTTPGGGVVRGRVVQKEGGVPLRGIAIELTRFDSLLSYLRADVNGRFDVLRCQSGDDGRFAFLDVTPAEDYVVRVVETGFAIASSDELDLRGRETVDVGDLALGPGATASGRVLDHEGKPAADVRVAATWRITNPLGIILTDPDTAPALQMEATTDENGRYTLEHLEPTATTLFFVAPSGASDVVRQVALDAAKPNTLPDVQLPGPRSLAGTVVWSDNTPIAAARVFAADGMGGAVRPTESAADGTWRLEYLPAEKRTNLGVLIPGLPVRMVLGVEIGREDVRIEFPMPGKLEGQVVEAKSGAPVSRFRIQLKPAAQPKDWMARMVATQVQKGLGATPFVAEDGRFVFERVAPGTYTAEVMADGYPSVKQEGVVVVARETASVTIEIPDGHVGRGTVRRSSGDPVKGARLYVIFGGVKAGSQGPQLHGYIADREPDAVTRADGVYELPPQTPGRYDVIASHPDLLPGVLRGMDLRAGDAADQELVLPPSGAVRGLILDEHARPAKGETVYVLYRNGIVRTVESKDDGRFELKGMPVGRCIVRWLSLRTAGAHYRTYRGGSAEDKEKAYDQLRLDGEEHEITDGGVAEVSLRLPQRTKVSGRLRVPEEALVGQEGFYVTVSGGGHWIEVKLQGEGEFEAQLLPGRYIAYVPIAKNSWSAIEFEVPDAPTHRVELGE
ncbi:MAG: carboxypeptidase-like regulatory domain-containing protein [Planctomycetota bacterium]|nr:carboxypeptidase-like regulatory domain-containing protein [Planctomycetota bacterium]